MVEVKSDIKQIKFDVKMNIETNVMQIIQTRWDIIEKTLRDNSGRLVQARFYIYENAGRIKVRLIDFVYLSQEVVKSAVFFITGFSKNQAKNLRDILCRIVSSPLLAFEILFFSGSKPRAPTV